MKQKVGKEREEGRKKRKEVENGNPCSASTRLSVP
jgi:hypothetical protein